MRRRRLLLAGLGLLAGLALPRDGLAQRRRWQAEPLPEPPPPAPNPTLHSGIEIRPSLGEPAPIPNRAIEAPPNRFATPIGPRLEPAIIDDSADPRRGFTFGREHLSSRQEQLLKDLAPGARIRIPLE